MHVEAQSCRGAGHQRGAHLADVLMYTASPDHPAAPVLLAALPHSPDDVGSVFLLPECLHPEALVSGGDG